MEGKEDGVGSEPDQERQRKEMWTPSAGGGEGSGVFQENVANFLFHSGGKCNGQGTRTGEKDPPPKKEKKKM